MLCVEAHCHVVRTMSPANTCNSQLQILPKMPVCTVIFILYGPFQDCEVTTNPNFKLQGMADDGLEPHM